MTSEGHSIRFTKLLTNHDQLLSLFGCLIIKNHKFKATFFTFVNAYDKLFVFISFSETNTYCKGTN